MSGTVPATLSLTLGAPATFAPFVPGVDQTYTASTTANVTSTAGDALLSVADPSPTATGRLVNGAFSLANAVEANANSGAYAPVGGSAAPTALLTYTGPTSANAVTLGFQQRIGRLEALRTGAYSKTLTFTLSTTVRSKVGVEHARRGQGSPRRRAAGRALPPLSRRRRGAGRSCP